MTEPLRLCATVGSLVAFSLLLVAGVEHALHRRNARRQLAAQRLWPEPLVPLVHALLTAAEVLMGAAGLLSVAVRPRLWLDDAAQLGGVALYGCFTLYSALLLRARPGAPCGCAGDQRPASAWTVARAALLTGLTALPLLAGQPMPLLAGELAHTAVVLLASATFLLLAWQLPDHSILDPTTRLEVDQ